MTLNLPKAIWERRCDDNVFELNLAIAATADVTTELTKVVDMCDELQGISDEFEEHDQDRLQDLAEDMRSRFQPAIQTIIDMLQEVREEAKGLMVILDKYSW